MNYIRKKRILGTLTSLRKQASASLTRKLLLRNARVKAADSDTMSTLAQTALLASALRPSGNSLIGTYNRDDSPTAFYDSDRSRELIAPIATWALGGAGLGALSGAGFGAATAAPGLGTTSALVGGLGGGLAGLIGGGLLGGGINFFNYNKRRTGNYFPSASEKVMVGKKLKELAEKTLKEKDID